jgi:hypothetical protein
MLNFFFVNYFKSSLIFAGKEGAPSGVSFSKAQALPTNITLRWKLRTLTNALAYYGAESNEAEKSFLFSIGTNVYDSILKL